ncbi:MAG: cupin domain-containing protein [Myxococcota bacterium]
MSKQTKYDIDLKPLYPGLTKIELSQVKKLTDHPWFNRTLCQVNDSVVRVGVLKGEFHWHAHEYEDEFFYVVDGVLHIEIDGQDTVTLNPNEGIVVPRGVRHRPYTPEGATVLMVEKESIVPTGSE